MSRNYYYLVAGLPDLFLDQESKDFNIERIIDDFREHLHPSDFELIEVMNLPFDNENFLNAILKRKREYSVLGRFGKEHFEDLNESITLFPKYFQQFYAKFTGKQTDEDEISDDSFDGEKIEKTPEVIFNEFFYQYITNHSNVFIKDWFTFLQNLQNILAAISCRNSNTEIIPHLVGAGSVQDALARSQAPDFGLKRDIEYIDRLLAISEISDVLDRERRIDLLKWEMVNELVIWEYFSTEFILAFMVKAQLVFRWTKLDAKVGAEMFKMLMSDLRGTYEMPKEISNK